MFEVIDKLVMLGSPRLRFLVSPAAAVALIAFIYMFCTALDDLLMSAPARYSFILVSKGRQQRQAATDMSLRGHSASPRQAH